MRVYEAIPSLTWQALYLGLRAEETCEAATRALVAAHTHYYTALEFVRREDVEPFPWRGGGTIWIRRSWLTGDYDLEPEEEIWAQGRVYRPELAPGGQPHPYILLVECDEDWEYPIRGICGCPFAAVYSP